MALLEIVGLTKRFGGLAALTAVDFSVQPGEILSLIGPNGAGKTTLFDLISGNLVPDAGDIRFAGQSVLGLPPHEIARRGIGRTFQASRVFAHLSVLDNTLIGAHARIGYGVLGALARTPGVLRAERQARDAALSLLGIFGSRLRPRAEDFVITLSFANRRRAEIARALAGEPRLLLLDEPAAGMNPTEKREIAAHIRAIRDGGHTVVLIEHHMQTVMELSDRVVVLDHGEKIAEGPPAPFRRIPG
jgi:ABC-type branched-subunit amino acid transport system ATPase component